MLSSVSSSMFLTSRACSIVCCPSRTSMPSFCSSNIIGGSTTSTPSGMSPTPSASSIDLISCAALRNSVMSAPVAPRRPSSPRAAVVVVQPGRMQLVMPGGRAEIPDVGVAVAGQQRVARELVARPFADHGAGGVADVVLVEGQQRTQPGIGQRRARAREAVVVQPAEIDALLEIDLGVARAPIGRSHLKCGSMSSGLMIFGSPAFFFAMVAVLLSGQMLGFDSGSTQVRLRFDSGSIMSRARPHYIAHARRW